MLVDESEDRGDGLVESDLLVNRGSAVVAVPSVVDATAFDHQEESFRGRAKALERDLGHLGERRRGSLERGGIQAIDLEGHVTLAEKAQQGSLASVGQELVPIEGDSIAGLAVGGDQFLAEILCAATEDDVDAALEILGRDGLLIRTSGNGGDEARRGGVRGGRGGDEAAALTSGVHLLDEGYGLTSVLGDIDHTVIDALADTPAAAGRGRVGHDTAGGVGLTERTNDRKLAVHLHPIRGTLLGAGQVGLGGGQHREAHPVGDHEDHILGLALRGVGGSLAAVGAKGPGRARTEDEAAESSELQEFAAGRRTGLVHDRGIGSKDPPGQP